MGGGLAPAGHHDQVGAALGPLDDGLLGVVGHDDVGVDPHAHGLAELARLGDDVLADLDRMPDRFAAPILCSCWARLTTWTRSISVSPCDAMAKATSAA